MGLEQCTKCKEYYNRCHTYEYNLSQNTFNNPFFPRVDESLGDRDKDFLNVNNTNNAEEINEEEMKKRQEEMIKLKNLKKQILEKEREKRKQKDNNNQLNILNDIISDNKEKIINDNINELLEDMCVYGSITKMEILEEKRNNPDKFIKKSKALNSQKSDPNLFVLGLLSYNLEKLGIVTAIEEENYDELDASITCLQFIINGMIQKKKYDLHFELGKEREEELLNDENEYKKFKTILKRKLCKEYDIPDDKIIVTFPKKGSFRIQVIFQSDEFNELDLNDLTQKFQNDDEFKELINLKEIHSDVIMGGCKLSLNQLDPQGNYLENWPEGENFSGKSYSTPKGWIGIGLKVLDKYGDNEWIRSNNSDREWCIAYHGIGRGLEIRQVKDITGNIIKEAFKKDSGQIHKDCYDINNPGKTVGEGAYVTPSIETASEYCGTSEINGKSYQIILMVRVKPKAIRQCHCYDDCWVVNGTSDEIRPYKILYKEIRLY